MTYPISEIATFIGAQRIGTAATLIDWLLTDSRSLVFPEESLFFAIRTQKNDGHRYVEELYQRGVRAFVVAAAPEHPHPDANYLVVTSPLRALQRLAERHRERFGSLEVVGITGSNGKTIVKEWLYQLLAPERNITRSPRSWNSQIGVPLSVWRLSEATQLGIFEAGISEPGEMSALEAIIQPTIGVLTHMGPAHDENFGSRREKCMEKLRLFRHARALVYDSSDAALAECIQASGFAGELIDSRPYHAWTQPDTSGPHPQAYAGSHTENIATCVAVALYLGLDEATLRQRIAHLEPVAMRLEVKEGLRGCTLITDTCNSDLDSLETALDFMRRRQDSTRRRHTLILSDIKQTGLTLTQLYTRVATLVASYSVDEFVGIGPEVCAGMANVRQRPEATAFHLFTTVDAFLASTLCATMEERVVLVKGARAAHFERIVGALEQRQHQTTLEVNLSALVENLNHYRSFMQPQTKMVCMVKASAYGAGAVEVARTLQQQRVDYLAVAVADEGVELRRAGITANIMVMNPEMGTFPTLFNYNLEPEVYSFALLDALIHDARREGVTNFPIHLKLDTGMHRLGFHPERDVQPLIARLQAQKALLPRSVFTHFVGSDSPDFDAFTLSQWQRFSRAADQLQAAFPYHILRHICNTAAIPRFPDRHADMVRLGLGLYGIAPTPDMQPHLTPVSTLKTTILQIHDVPAGETVGYSRRELLTRDSRIAALPIGYADGLNRHLGCRRGHCLVGGRPAPYVGNICMDVAMIDVTDIPCREGDTAIVFGPQLPPTDLAEAIGTIPYEILTAVAPRVRRHYYVD
ncbi:MAG: alanine racemase [Bacteroidaceae bacterium]|nr:alanine racemase [Bacteroidaceae bacterium]